MELDDILRLVTPEVHAALRTAVETGRWADGNTLTREQRELCLQALIAWEARHLAPEQRVGHIDRGSKAEGARCDAPPGAPEPVRFLGDTGPGTA